MIWDELTSQEIGRLDKNIPVIVPIAATEQHGPHLPLATDRMIAQHFAKKLHEAIAEQVLILPVISVGCSDHHMDFPGTLSLSHEGLSKQVQEIISSVIHHGFNKIILLNSHGGNQGVGQVKVEQLGYQYPACHFVLITWWKIAADALKKISETGFGGVGHAGEFETSLMMLIAPNLVVSDKIEPGANEKTFSWADGDMLHSPMTYYYRTMKEMTGNGVFGNPTKASVQKGQQITECVVSALQNIVIDLISAKKAK